MSLLQQDNLIPSTTNYIISSSNQVTPFARIHMGHSPNELGPSNTCIFNTCVFSYSESNNISLNIGSLTLEPMTIFVPL